MVASQSPNMTDYEVERRSFQLEVPEYFNFATDVVEKWASDPNKPAMLWVGQHGEEQGLTFAPFAEYSSLASNAFSALVLGKGAPVLVILLRLPAHSHPILR